MENILYEKRGEVAILTLNRPQALNALDRRTMQSLAELLDESLADVKVKSLVLTGAGEKSFAAGADLEELMDLSPKEANEYIASGQAVMDKVENYPIPVIAAVNGFALGGGCELALSCDIRLASPNAVFGLPEVALGIIAGYGGIPRLVRTVGLAKAKEICFRGQPIKAGQALGIGLVNDLYPQEELLAASLAMATIIAANAPLAVRATKEIANASAGLELREIAGLERAAFAKCFDSNDRRLGMAAFKEKKKPRNFTGS
jgi:enoyl-CoA hydratase